MNNPIRYVRYTELYHAISTRLEAVGLTSKQAGYEAELMIEADQMEVPSHGLIMLPRLLFAIETGALDIHAEPRLEMEFAAAQMKDYRYGLGRVAALDAMNTAVKLAHNYGVGVCVAKNTTHWGRACAYVERAARQGCIAICATNAMPSMTAGAATKAVLGNNPLAIAVPSDPPVVLDMAMSEAAIGKIATYLREDKKIPEHWGMNEDGNPSCDPQDILRGAVTPFAGHKGTGLAVMLELMTSALSGGLSAPNLSGQNQAGVDSGASKIFIAIKINCFSEIEDYQARVKAFIAYLKSQASPVLYPGERSYLALQKNRDKVPLHEDILKALREVEVKI